MKNLVAVLVFLFSLTVFAQEEGETSAEEQEVTSKEEQNADSKALDATATQWSFQLAYQDMPDYYDDLVNGTPRRPGLDNYVQLRVVAPIPLKSLTILPRVTIRHYEDLSNGQTGFGNTELFALIIPKATDWGTGRSGIGPLVTTPGDKDVAKDEWGYGFAATIVNNSGQWFYGLLFTQSWRAVDPSALQPEESSNVNPLGIAPFVNYRFGSSGFYLGTPDMVALYDWNTKGFYLPIGARFGKVWVLEKGSINAYLEYRTSAIYKSWEGPAVKNSFRVNFTYTMPFGGGKK
jgi:hypothetical protein